MTATHAHDAAALPKHEFLAGRIALDFCNSVSPTRRVTLHDRILKPGDFLGWAQRAGIAVDRAPTPPALARLHRLRGALIGIFHALAEQRTAPAEDLALLNAELAEGRAAERLVPMRDGYAMEDSAPAAIDRFRHADCTRCRRSSDRRSAPRQTLPQARLPVAVP